MFAGFLDALFNGISIGAVLLIAALGLAIVFGLMGVINMAHGELMMLGAYTTFVVQNFCKQLGGFWFEIYIFLALILAFFLTAIAGLILEKGVIRYLYGRPLETLLATWGVSLILQQFVRSVNWVIVIGIAIFCLLFFGGLRILKSRANISRVQNWIVAVLLVLSLGVAIATGNLLSQTYQLAVTQPWFGAQNLDVTAPTWLQDGLSLGSLQLPYARLFIIALTIVCVGGIYIFLQRSNWGLRIRAVTQNRSMSACLGIPTAKVDAITFALGSGLAGVAGCAISLLGSVGPNTGQNYIIDTFMVVVVGGVGNLLGTIVAALGIGTVNYLIGSGTLALLLTPIPPLVDFFNFFATTSMAKVMVFALIIAFLQWKPGGIFPQKGRTVDA
ncbi:branched-chain amino acid ABC transporter permease [Chlorogloeopsis fritschii PCC 9212]|uniref:Branched-chain amino acid ABC transporter permease n=1 Tax=Chlorogloeopsis fritschii PCC 6912 TaxID=211165 RepID=A0A433MZ48_CHLFR|nr:branched-chain amino acid ABC transporter permease [Chlorogloeopsis fritschii]MBF2005457.1 branched-chain amino acid ABC transporter permease [Chlorogloeopsis fritschii C42_A2020_084]RUR73754.1 branched-chain amino acid ABC transporter permease [Chlorogloeopsis fritschii PCC 6912]